MFLKLVLEDAQQSMGGSKNVDLRVSEDQTEKHRPTWTSTATNYDVMKLESFDNKCGNFCKQVYNLASR